MVVEGNSVCASACALAFLGGHDNSGEPWRSSSSNSRLGFHAFASADAPLQNEGETQLVVSHVLAYGREVQAPLDLLILNFATLAIAGRPWGITSAFALWGAKGAQAIGFDPTAWAYWQQPGNAKALAGSVFADVTSVMDFGLIAGAMLAAALAGKFAPSLDIPLRSILAAVVGGLLLGYGARIAYGCNIGAYFSGIASGSLHGYLWAVAAFAGNVLGVKLRPFFFMEGRSIRRADG